MRQECTPEQKEACTLRRCFTNQDHYYWPASDYKTPVERAFRNLPENIEEKCRNEHNERHATEEPPEKPSIQYMAEAVLNAEVHQTTKVAKQIQQIMRNRQAAMSSFWRGIEDRK